MTLSSNVARFEFIMYVALGIGFVGSAATFLQPRAGLADTSTVGSLIFSFGLRFLLVWIAARYHANWARWGLLGLVVLGSLLFLVTMRGQLRAAPVPSVLNLIMITGEAIALFLVFTGDAVAWFRPQIPPQTPATPNA